MPRVHLAWPLWLVRIPVTFPPSLHNCMDGAALTDFFDGTDEIGQFIWCWNEAVNWALGK